jgi:hypothetical protein
VDDSLRRASRQIDGSSSIGPTFTLRQRRSVGTVIQPTQTVAA